MRRDVATAAAEGLQERIWDLHDKLSHAMLPISACAPRGAQAGGGCVIPRVQRGRGDRCSAAAAADARSLHAIRAALEDLEGHLHFLRDVIAQQQAEQGAAIVRLQQSHILLGTRLAEHRWRRHRVIEETLAFVDEVLDKTWFASPVDVCGVRNQSGENEVVPSGHGSNIVVRVLSFSLALFKNSLRWERIGGVLGNAAVFALGMLAFVQLQQVAFHKQSLAVEFRRNDNRFRSGSSRKNSTKNNLEVSFARG
uniref:Uncharacterized protein n=1 Tax=Arundo donax TaxID=35708 RepID=A0A0A9GF09_ARUDO